MSVPSGFIYQPVYSQHWPSISSAQDNHKNFKSEIAAFQLAIQAESTHDISKLAQNTDSYQVLIEAMNIACTILHERFSLEGITCCLAENLKIEDHELQNIANFIRENLLKYQCKTIEALLLWAAKNQYLEIVQLILAGSQARSNRTTTAQLSNAIQVAGSIFENLGMESAIVKAIDISAALGGKEMAALLLMDPRLNPQLIYDKSDAILSAAKKSHLDILDLLLQDGRFNPYPALNWACEQSNQQVFDKIKDYLKFNLNSDQISRAIYSASKHGNKEMVTSLLKNKYFRPFDRTDLEAKMAHGVEWLVDHGPFSHTRIGRMASLHFGGKVSSHDLKALRWEDHIKAACDGEHLEIAKMLFKYAQSYGVQCHNKWRIEDLNQKLKQQAV